MIRKTKQGWKITKENKSKRVSVYEIDIGTALNRFIILWFEADHKPHLPPAIVERDE